MLNLLPYHAKPHLAKRAGRAATARPLSSRHTPSDASVPIKRLHPAPLHLRGSAGSAISAHVRPFCRIAVWTRRMSSPHSPTKQPGQDRPVSWAVMRVSAGWSQPRPQNGSAGPNLPPASFGGTSRRMHASRGVRSWATRRDRSPRFDPRGGHTATRHRQHPRPHQEALQYATYHEVS